MKTLSLLYVEDNDEVRELMEILLEAEGRRIVCCATAEEALVLDAATPFDIVMTDISLPGMSGTDLARRLLAAAPERWIFICSGYAYGAALSVLGPHVRELPKPFEPEQFDALADEALASISARQPG